MQKSVKTYEEYCKGFSNEESRTLAYLLLSLQSWIIRVDDICVKDDTITLSLDQLLNREDERNILTDDYLTWIVKNSSDAINFLSKHMKEDILRENIKMPFFKAKEFNSQCFNWLSRQAGDNVKEKILNSSKNVLAVKRRMTFNTGENRLYISLLRELMIYEGNKIQNFNVHNISSYELDSVELYHIILGKKEYEEIGEWGNTLPNNTLLADKNYRQIWNAWLILKNIDKDIENLSKNLKEKEAISYYFDLLSSLSKYFRFPQCPIIYDVEKMEIETISSANLVGINNFGEKILISRKNNEINLSYKQKYIQISFEDKKIICKYNKDLIEFDNNIGTRSKLLTIVKNKLITNEIEIPIVKSKTKKEESICLDIYSVRPSYINEKNVVENIPGLILAQSFDINKNELLVSCSTSKALFSQAKTFSFINSIENSYSNELTFLTHSLEKYYSTNSTTIVVPDKFDVFQLSTVIKSVKLISKDVDIIPRSIGSVFYYNLCDKSVTSNDVFIVADYIDNNITLTLVNGEVNNKVRNSLPNYNGIIWSRQLTKIYQCKKDIVYYLKNNNLSPNIEKYIEIFGISGTKEELRHIPIVEDNGDIYLLDERTYKILSSFQVELDPFMKEFLSINEFLIRNKKIHLICLSHSIKYSGQIEFGYNSVLNSLKGCNVYKLLQKDTKEQLWHDYLPSLSIKLLYGTFSLIKKASVKPIVNTPQPIQISDTFTLTKGKKEYRLSLIQDDSNQSLRYAAIVKNQVFPLEEDVECELNLSYCYGSEQPFTLIFSPKNKNKENIFKEAKVDWTLMKYFPYEELSYPAFVYQKKWGELDLNNDISYIKDSLLSLNYLTIDLRRMDYTISGSERGSRTIKFRTQLKNETIEIILNERAIEKDEKEYRNLSFDTPGIISFNLTEAHDRLTVSLPDDIEWFGADGNKFCTYYLNVGNNQTVKVFISQKQFEFEEDFSINEHNLSFLLVENKTSLNENRYFLQEDFEWRKNDYGYFCIKNILINGVYKSIAFYGNNFQDPFSETINNVSFEIKEINGKLSAIKIRDESIKTYKAVRIRLASNSNRKYSGNHIRSGDKPPAYLYNGVYSKIQNIFQNNLSVFDDSCPVIFKEAFVENIDNLIEVIKRVKQPFVQKRLIGILSVLANDFPDKTIELISSLIDLGNQRILPHQIGYVLNDLKCDYQLKLLYKLEQLPVSDVICILAKSIWFNESFVYNIPIDFCFKWFNIAISNLESFMLEEKKKNLACSLEFILGVFRLRSLNDDNISKYLSLNNDNIQLLYSYIEKIIHDNIQFKSFLELNIADKGAYQNIPDLLYALLIYITGQKNSDGILITGVNDSEENE